MKQASRHQCLIYKGSPARHLPALAALMHQKLKQRNRCLYLDSPPMIAGMRYYLAAAGVDVAREVEKVETAVHQALSEGYQGLWATGDMTWEIGSKERNEQAP